MVGNLKSERTYSSRLVILKWDPQGAELVSPGNLVEMQIPGPTTNIWGLREFTFRTNFSVMLRMQMERPLQV